MPMMTDLVLLRVKNVGGHTAKVTDLQYSLYKIMVIYEPHALKILLKRYNTKCSPQAISI
jgi:hypothetical protein